MVKFRIIEYTDDTFRVESTHAAYHYRDGLHYDNVEAWELPEVMRKITETLYDKYFEEAVFEIK